MAAGFLQRRSVRFGIPFLLLILGGSFGLREFAHLRYQFRKRKTITKEEAEKFGLKMKEPGEVTLESEFEKIKDLDTTNWENKRGPRPWEEGNQLYAEAVERGKALKRK